ncbi:hypothetical protein [Bradyrhizobium sp. AUGA SZCCT0042]|nr:hypothetical protein [Bradyrhizobium sp. AUGA SZCCT0042]MBR1229290.1 hypothetical protein [Bradyrhizobium sp. AUGA SZCCT0176]MBR1300944.1 hypothetical protein [Bradyrhizobium sp. AUGA SZCCT0042]
MKFFTGWVFAAGTVLATTAAQAQVPAPYEAGRSSYYSVSDIGDPYYAPRRYAPPPAYPGPRYGYGQGPMLLPPTEVYTVVRESGFSPLGIPQQRGFVYTISVIDRGGDDGRLIIDARTGRIIRFIPAHRMGDNFNDDLTMNYGPPGSLPPTHARGAPRPPKPAPQVASHTVPVPKPSPLAAAKQATAEPAAKAVAARPAAAEPAAKPAAAAEPVQQSAAAQPKSAEAQTTPAAAVTTGVVQAKPVPQIAPTQEMPNVQGLE